MCEPARLAEWIEADPLDEVPQVAPVAAYGAETIVSADCDDLDECGLPSD